MKKLLTIFLLITGFSAAYSAPLLYRTSSNTIVYWDDYETQEFVDPNGLSTALANYGNGFIRNDNSSTSPGDGPTVDIVSDSLGNIYVAGEITTYSQVFDEPPFSGASGRYRPDVYVMKINSSGVKQWDETVILRSTNEDYITFVNNPDRNVNLAVDDATGVLYASWMREDQNNNYHTYIQRIDPDGSKPWGNEIEVYDNRSYYGTGIVVLGNYVYVFFEDNHYVLADKIDTVTGAIVLNDVPINATSYNDIHYPRAIESVDDSIYVVWQNDAGAQTDIWGQRVDADLNRINWGGNTTDKRINNDTGYDEASYSYGDTENEVNIDMDTHTGATNLYVVWSLALSGNLYVWAQKIDCTAGGFERQWTNTWGVNTDKRISKSSSVNGDVYCDIAIADSVGYVSYITHDDAENNDMMIQKINLTTGNREWGDDPVDTDVGQTMRIQGRIATFQDNVWAVSVYDHVKKFNFDKFEIDFVDFRDRNYVTKFFYSTYRVIPGTVLSATLRQEDTTYNLGTYFKYWMTPDNGVNTYGPYYISNQTGLLNFNFSNYSNDLRFYMVGDNTVGEGKDYIAMHQVSVEANRIYLGDALVGKAPDASDALGELIVNEDSSGQSMNIYVYNNGVNRASGYFFIKNNGNVSSNFQLKTASTGNANWDVEYWLCDSMGDTNRNITAQLTGAGFTTNISMFTNDEWVVIKAFAQPDLSLSAGDYYSMVVDVFAEVQGNFVQHDQATLSAVISTALPDLIVQGKGEALGLGFQDGAANGQIAEWVADTNVTRIFKVHLKNSGGSDSVFLKANFTNSDWTVAYFTNGVDITVALTNGISNFLNSEEYISNIEVHVTPLSGATLNSALDLTFDAISYGDPSKVDKVIARTRRVRSQVDLLIDGVGNGVRNLTSTGQIVTNFSDNGITNEFTVTVQNEGSYTMDFYLLSTISNTLDPGWKVEFGQYGNDITVPMKTTYYTVSNLRNGSSTNITIRIIAPPTHNDGANEVMGVYVTAKSEGDTNHNSKKDQCGAQHKTISSRVVNYIDTNPVGSVLKYVKTGTNFLLTVSNSSKSGYKVDLIGGSIGSGFGIAYTNNGADITTAIEGAGWTIDLASGQSTNVSVTAWAGTVSIGDRLVTTNTATSWINPNDEAISVMIIEKAVAPDALIRKQSEGLYEGQNKYGINPETINQVKNSTYPQGGTNYYKYIIKLENDRPYAESFKITGSLDDNNWDVKYYRCQDGNKAAFDPDNPAHWTDVTASVTNSAVGDIYNSVSAADYAIYRIDVRTGGALTEGDDVDIDLMVTGVDTAYKDVVRVKMTYGIGLPDLVYSMGVNPFTDWDDVYVGNYDQAVATNYADKAMGSTFIFSVENDSSTNSSFYLSGSGDSGGWNILYQDELDNDITASMISGTKDVYISNNSSINLKVTLNAAGSSYDMLKMTNIDIRVFTEQQELDDYLRITTFLTDIGRPDLVVGNNGDGYYNSAEGNSTGTNLATYWGKETSIPVVIENDQTRDEIYKIYGTGSAPFWNIEYSTNGVDVTANVINGFVVSGLNPYVGGYTVLIPANSCITLDTKITLASNCNFSPGTTKDVYVYAYSEGRLQSDKGRIRLTVADPGRPDLVASSSGIWDGLYENNPASQVVSTNTEKGWINRYIMQLENERNATEEMHLLGNSGAGDWEVEYFYFDETATAWSNITFDVTNLGGDILIPANSCITLAVETLVPKTATNQLNSTFSVEMKLLSWMSFVTDSGVISNIIRDMSSPDLSFTNGLWNDMIESVAISGSSTTNLYLEKGDLQQFYVYIENDSDVRSNQFYLSGTGGSGYWEIAYEEYRPPTDDFLLITYEVTNGEYKTYLSTNEALTNINDSKLIRITAMVATNADMPTNSMWNVDLLMESEFGQKRDMGRLQLVYVDKGNPDLVINGSQGDNIRETPPNLFSQTTNILMEKGERSYLPVYVQNDRVDKDETFHLIANAPSSTDFSIDYYWITNNITNSILSSITNWTFYPEVPLMSELTLLVELSLNSNSVWTTNYSEAINMNLISFGGAYTDVINMNYVIADLSEPNVYLTNDLSWSNRIESIPEPQYQKLNLAVEMGHTNTLVYYLLNDRSKGEEFTYVNQYKNTLPSNWQMIHYWDDTGVWSNITAIVTNGWQDTWNGKERKLLKTVVYIPYNDTYTNVSGEGFTMDMRMLSWMGYEYDKGRINYALTDASLLNINNDALTWGTVNTDPEAQKQAIDIEKGITNSYRLRIINQRDTFDKFRLNANSFDWNSEYYLITNYISNSITNYVTNLITTEMTNGMYLNLSNLQTVYLDVVCFADYDDTNARGTVKNLNVVLSSYLGDVVDIVTLEYTLKDFSKPDILIDGRFDDLYAYLGDLQITNYYIEKGESLTQTVLYQNDFTRAYTYVLQSEPFGADWDLEYFISNATVMSNITFAITNAGFTNLFVNNESNFGQVVMTLNSNSTMTTNQTFTNKLKMYSLAKLRIEEASGNIHIIDRGAPEMVFVNDAEITNLYMKRGDTNVFHLVMSNGRSDNRFTSENMNLKLDTGYFIGWDYRLHFGTNDITADITNQGFGLNLANGDWTNFVFTVSLNESNTNSSGVTNGIGFVAYSQGKGKTSTAVLNVIKQEPTPDLTAIYLSGTGAVGDNIYNDPTNQSITGYVIAASPAVYSIILENDDVIDDQLEIGIEYDPALKTKWTLSIEDDDLGIELSVMLESNIIYSIPAGASKMFILNVGASESVQMNETNVVKFITRSQTDTNKYDVVTVNSIRVPVTISGQIYSYGGEMLSNATVKLESLFSSDSVETATDGEGNYELLAVPGTYTLRCSRQGYVDSSATVTIKEVQYFSLDDVYLLPVNVDEDTFNAHSFPNPAGERDEITIVVNHLRSGPLRVEIYNMKGVLVRSLVNEDRSADVYTIKWDSRDEAGAYMESGVYLLMTYDGQEMKTKKLFIQKSE